MSAGAGTAALKAAVHRRLLAAAPSTAAGRPALRALLADLVRHEAPLLAPAAADRVLDELVDEVDGLGPLAPLLADPDVTEVMLNGPGAAYVERAGRLERVDLDLPAAEIARLAERVVMPLGLRLDRSAPIADARLPDGSRVHAVLPPLAPDGPVVTIRRFRARAVPLAEFGIGPGAAAFLEAIVAGGWNVVVAGATSAGKTTLLGALAAAADPAQRIVTIEETAELRVDRPHVVRLEARPANAEGAGGATLRDLVRAALRMRPDRIVVGEVRGGEALDLLQALNTGHDGCLSTVHANGPADALARLETLVLLAGADLPLGAVRAQLASALDAVVFVARHPGGARRVEAVAEVGGRGRRAVRPLLVRDGERLAAVAPPRRPPRVPGVPLAEAWAAC